jgi:hypothetical protein
MDCELFILYEFLENQQAISPCFNIKIYMYKTC